MNAFNHVAWLREFRFLSEAVRNGDVAASARLRKLRAGVFQYTTHIVYNKRYISMHGREVILPDDDGMIRQTAFYTTPIVLPYCVSDVRQETAEPTVPTQVWLENNDSLLAAKALLDKGYRPAVLNMANRQTPGGGVLTGAGAQEENLFRRTNLFRSLFQFAPHAYQFGLQKSSLQYPLDRNFGGVYTPDALVFRGTEQEGYPLLDAYYSMSFITVPAMNRPALTGDGRIAPALVEGVKNKMRTIFRIGLLHEHDALVLGAWGCGAFRNPPRHIASLFREVMEEPEFRNAYRTVCFAILDDHNMGRQHNPEGNLAPFAEVFSKKL